MTERPKVQAHDIAAIQTAEFIAKLLVGLVTLIVTVIRFVVTVSVVLGRHMSVTLNDPRVRSALASSSRNVVVLSQTLIEHLRRLGKPLFLPRFCLSLTL
jgi:hypothetical protein